MVTITGGLETLYDVENRLYCCTDQLPPFFLGITFYCCTQLMVDELVFHMLVYVVEWTLHVHAKHISEL